MHARRISSPLSPRRRGRSGCFATGCFTPAQRQRTTCIPRHRGEIVSRRCDEDSSEGGREGGWMNSRYGERKSDRSDVKTQNRRTDRGVWGKWNVDETTGIRKQEEKARDGQKQRNNFKSEIGITVRLFLFYTPCTPND